MWRSKLWIAMLLIPFWGQSQCEVLVWSDEFDGDALNTENWSYQIGNGCPNLCGWGNNELQYYTDREENVNVANGLLTITGRQENFAGNEYTSGRIRSINKVDFCMGRIESRIKVPAGQGYWPALWMLASEPYYGGWPISGEIDIMEVSGNNVNNVVGTIHYGPLFPENQYTGNTYTVGSPNLSEDFHDYAIEWTESEIKWFIDGILYSTKTPADLGGNPWHFDRNFHLILNLAIGGWFPGFPDGSAVFPGKLEIDYIRVYQTLEESIISGRKLTQAGSLETYYCPSKPGATYNWTVDSDANITGGQGTNEVTVQMGNDDVNLSVEIDLGECISTIDKAIELIGDDCEGIFTDFADKREIFRIRADGNLNAFSANPVPDEVNPSSECGSYVRNSGVQYDALLLTTDVFGDPQAFVDGEMKLAMDVFTSEPVGRGINLQFESQPRASGGFPNGRHSVYSSSTEESGAWHTIYFDYIQSPDANIGDDVVNQLTILFEPNTFENSVFFFDNLRVVNASCLANSISEKSSGNVKIYPNPSHGSFQVELNDVGTYNWEIYTSEAKLIRSGQVNADRFELTENLSPGIYQFRVIDQKGIVRQQKLIVQ